MRIHEYVYRCALQYALCKGTRQPSSVQLDKLSNNHTIPLHAPNHSFALKFAFIFGPLGLALGHTLWRVIGDFVAKIREVSQEVTQSDSPYTWRTGRSVGRIMGASRPTEVGVAYTGTGIGPLG